MGTAHGKTGYSPEAVGTAVGPGGYGTLGGAANPGSTLNNGLVAYWNLDEVSGNRADSVDTNTLQDNGSTGSTTGIHNLAASFVAANGTYLLAADAGLHVTNKLGVSAWVNHSSGNYDFAKFTAMDSGGLGIFVQLSTSAIIFFDNSATISATFSFPSGWHHFVLSYDGTGVDNDAKVQIYVDGTPASIAWAGLVPTSYNGNTSPWALGATGDGGGPATTLIDEVGFWGRKLTSGEAAELYNGGSGKFYPF